MLLDIDGIGRKIVTEEYLVGKHKKREKMGDRKLGGGTIPVWVLAAL